MTTTTISDLLTKLQQQVGALRKGDFVLDGSPEARDLVDDMHDWDAYDSSDIHLRTREWETQARPTVIQHFVPKKQPITATQLQHANVALMQAMPGVQLSPVLRQHKAHALLVEFVGLDAANTIMAGE